MEHAWTRSPKLWLARETEDDSTPACASWLWQLKSEETYVSCAGRWVFLWHTLARLRFMTRFARGRFCVPCAFSHFRACRSLRGLVHNQVKRRGHARSWTEAAKSTSDQPSPGCVHRPCKINVVPPVGFVKSRAGKNNRGAQEFVYFVFGGLWRAG